MFKITKKCKILGCNIEVHAKKVCFIHYQRMRNTGKYNSKKKVKTKGRLCSIDGCIQRHLAKGYCLSHYQHFNYDKARKYNLNLKIKTFEHYCNGFIQCACCGENNLSFLTLDHIIPIKRSKRIEQYTTGKNLFRLLMKSGFPEGYQVLCYNCNCAKRINTNCPHQTNK